MQAYAIETLDLTKRFKAAPLEESEMWTEQLTKLVLGKFRKKRKITAVDHISFKVKKGEMFGLLGPNGAGKTTLIKLLACLLYPDEGTALVNGYDIRKDRKKVKASINIVASGAWTGFSFALTVKKNLEFIARMYGIPKGIAQERIAHALDFLELSDKKDELPWNLSSGMRQKLLLAKVFLIRTPIVLLDEPTMGLDPRMVSTFREYVKETLKTEFRQTIIIATHYMEEAELLCDRVAIMKDGKIVALNTPRDLTKLVSDEEMVEFTLVNLTSSLVERLKEIEHVDLVVTNLDNAVTGSGRVRIYAYDIAELMPELLRQIEQGGAHIRHVVSVEPTLDDVFTKLTGEQMRQ